MSMFEIILVVTLPPILVAIVLIVNNSKVTEAKINPQWHKPVTKKNSSYTEDIKKIDINRATESELICLPGISLEVARQALLIQDQGGFDSLNDFIDWANVYEYAKEVSALACCYPIKKGRSRARMVDM